MSRDIDFSKTLSEDEVRYLQERDDERLQWATLPGDTEVDVNPDVRGTINESGLDEIRPDEDEPVTPAEVKDESDKDEAEATPAKAARKR